jgi:hypothetical protein
VIKEKVLTGLSPPGGLVLAQLHFGSLHTEASQEYPAASELLVGPLILPSWARESPSKRSKRNGTTSIGENNKMRGDACGRGKGAQKREAGLKRTWIEKREQLRPTWGWELGGHDASQPKMRAKIISEVASWSEERRAQAEKLDRLKVIRIDGRFIFHAILL